MLFDQMREDNSTTFINPATIYVGLITNIDRYQLAHISHRVLRISRCRFDFTRGLSEGAEYQSVFPSSDKSLVELKIKRDS